MNSSVTWDSATSVMSSLCLEIRPSSRSNGPSNTSRCTSKPAGAAGGLSSRPRPSGAGKSAGRGSALFQPSGSAVVAASADAPAVVAAATTGPRVAVVAVVQAAGVADGLRRFPPLPLHPSHGGDEQNENDYGNPDHW